MAAACLASFAILAGGLAALYGLDWYKNRKSTRDVKEGYTDKEPLAERLA